ncbi:AsmA family protein [Steroidobacter cummioxidans]|uniref:AsmA family protein n=1 Tax=Steroidobacter cummioxidans TaxID=1803913 RepID=UPI000E31B734|nr:AsmA family protein [Steroidobacter cummioxidans]
MPANLPTHRLRPLSWRAVLKWTAISIGGIFVLLLLFLAFADWNWFKGPIERMASARSGRAVTIEGKLDVHALSLTPRASVERLTVGNPPWDAKRPMVRIEQLKVQVKLLPLFTGDVILPRVELVRPDVYLHRDAQGRANWTFENTRPSNAPAGKPPKLPVIRDFLVEDGRLTIRDERLKLKVDGSVQAHESVAQNQKFAFGIQGKGSINEQPFNLTVGGGPLVNLDPDEPYPFKLQMRAGDIRVESDGTVRKPFDLARLELNVHAKGGDLADLYYLTQLALPNTPAFELTAHVQRNVQIFKVTKVAGKIGQSDIAGDLTVDASRKRPTITGDLHSRQLRLVDLAPALGSKPATAGSLQAKSDAPKAATTAGAKQAKKDPNARLFPTSHLQVDRVRAMDADVRFQAGTIDAGSVPLQKVAFHVQLDDGLLTVSPFEFQMPQGALSGTARIDARGKIPQTKLDIRIKDVQLDQLKGKKPDAQPPLEGVIHGRAIIEGPGDSVHSLMAGADGRVSLILPSGEVNAALAELTGINVARGLGLLLKGNDDKAPIRCGVAQFEVKDGTMRADNVVFDTQDVRITTRGEVRLGPEELDLSIKGEPKKLRIARLRTPVEVNGHLLDPSIGVNVGKVAGQGAVAAAIGVVLTPLAAIIAFVDPGLAENENCAALLDSAKSGS